jgi:hypothetical protein
MQSTASQPLATNRHFVAAMSLFCSPRAPPTIFHAAPFMVPARQLCPLEQFQEKWKPVFRPELRENKEMERFHDSEKNGNARKATLEPAAVKRLAR